MKKVLILSVIAMLALGVMALASGNGALYGEKVLSTNPYGWVNSAQQGPTCNATQLVVYSEVGVEQGYVATATSYDASFCGAPCPCSCPEGTSVIYRTINGYYTSVTYNPDGILISTLSVKSNMQPINVSVTVTQPTSSGNTLPMATYYLMYYSNGTSITSSDFYDTNPHSISMTLNGASSPYNGKIDVVIDGYHTAWGKVVPVGDYIIATTFTISPQNTF
ncbi:MAG: hypothetical protein ACP5G8_01225 [Athalassotoga sp.]